MSPIVSFTSIRFRNFKALGDYSVSLQRLNMLTGPNNCGKSTIIGAFRALNIAMRRARVKNPTYMEGPKSHSYVHGHNINQNLLPISVANVHTDYSEEDSLVTFRVSNGNTLHLFFPKDGGCIFFAETAAGKPVKTTASFKTAFPIILTVVPILGPVEKDERILEESTVANDLGTHRASRHFRNYWHHYPEGFEKFAELVKTTWPSMEIRRPERTDQMSNDLVMFCVEDRIPRELFWAGYGFQIWCQLLTHIARAEDSTLLVIDEPEVYLHPDVQRQLVTILKSQTPDVLLATHSAEILSEADPADILLIDKSKTKALRLQDVEGVQQALDEIGSLQNLTLTQLAKNKCLLFVEGPGDFRLLKRIATKMGLYHLAVGSAVTAVPSGSFSTWKEILHFASTSHKAIGTAFRIGAIFDRDFFPPEEIVKIREAMDEHLDLVYFHARKEIENYLLIPAALDRAVQKQITEKKNRGSATTNAVIESSRDVLERLSESLKTTTQGQLVSRREKYLKDILKDPRSGPTITIETLTLFEKEWGQLDSRLRIIGGKALLQEYRSYIQHRHGVTITDGKIVEAMTQDEIPVDLKALVQKLDDFCQTQGKKPKKAKSVSA
jgi:energy-coupling factor transporter ATP-binding protein EcfA2